MSRRASLACSLLRTLTHSSLCNSCCESPCPFCFRCLFHLSPSPLHRLPHHLAWARSSQPWVIVYVPRLALTPCYSRLLICSRSSSSQFTHVYTCSWFRMFSRIPSGSYRISSFRVLGIQSQAIGSRIDVCFKFKSCIVSTCCHLHICLW